MVLHNADTHSPLLRLGDRPADHRRFGVGPLPVALFEDGLRTDPGVTGAYEWWYFDSHLENGARLVVLFATKNPAHPNTGLKPFVTIDLDLPDGRSLSKSYTGTAGEFFASAVSCDVRVGGNRFAGDLAEYEIRATIENVEVTVSLSGDVPPWRPATGYALFGHPARDRFFAWLAAVPSGRATVEYTVDGVSTQTTGSGYHDHNWGDAPMMSLMHDWYWGRAQIGPYSLIASYVTAEKKYDYGSQTSFVLSENGMVVAGDGARTTFSTDRVSTDAETGKPVADLTTYDYEDGQTRFVVTFERHSTILRTKFVDTLSGVSRLLAGLARFDGAYLRFAGTVTLSRFLDGELVEQLVNDHALWELMYFGTARQPAA